ASPNAQLGRLLNEPERANGATIACPNARSGTLARWWWRGGRGRALEAVAGAAGSRRRAGAGAAGWGRGGAAMGGLGPELAV
ncbi:MAG: hypothetical protein ACRDN0_06270, partial [Trebonia sp.]